MCIGVDKLIVHEEKFEVHDLLSPDYVPSVFSYVGSPDKRRAKRQLERYEQRRRLEYAQKSDDG